MKEKHAFARWVNRMSVATFPYPRSSVHIHNTKTQSGRWMAEKNEKCRKSGSSEAGAIHPAGGCPRLRKALEFFGHFRFFRLNHSFRDNGSRGRLAAKLHTFSEVGTARRRNLFSRRTATVSAASSGTVPVPEQGVPSRRDAAETCNRDGLATLNTYLGFLRDDAQALEG
jgi:hypothetical protein